MDYNKNLIDHGIARVLSFIASSLIILSLTILSGNADTVSADPTGSKMQSGDSTFFLAEINYSDGDLWLLDPASGQVVSIVHVGQYPISMAIRPGTMDAAVLCGSGTANIIIVNMTTREIYLDKATGAFLRSLKDSGIGTISKKGSADHMYWGPDGRYLYVITDTSIAAIDTGDTSGNNIVNRISIVDPLVAVDMSPDRSAMLMFRKVSYDTYIVEKINTTTNLIEKSRKVNLNFDASDFSPLRFSADGSRAYLFIDRSGNTFFDVSSSLIAIDNSTLEVNMTESTFPSFHSIDAVNHMELATDPFGKRLYILYLSRKIMAYDLATNSCISAPYTSKGYGELSSIALSPDGRVLFVTNYRGRFMDDNKISVLDAFSGELLDRINVGMGPMDVKVVPKINCRTL